MQHEALGGILLQLDVLDPLLIGYGAECGADQGLGLPTRE